MKTRRLPTIVLLERCALLALPVTFACTAAERGVPVADKPIAAADAAAGIAHAPVTEKTSPPPAPTRPGMAWIPAGVLRAGTPPNKVPRIPDEEFAGVTVPMGGFYIDQLPYPNEPGAIPTSNVPRDEAARLCESKGKRLCTELEWERACKGPANTTYEYGEAYRESACGTGVPAFHTARRPSGERATCKSAFGVLDMHGGMWEWTDTAWKRGPRASAGFYVLRGGNAEAGELVGRCANSIARKPQTQSPTTGFRCCAGPKNEIDIPLAQKKGPSLERSPKPAELAAGLIPHGNKKWGSDGAGAFVANYAWTWRPVANEELRIASGCAHPPDAAGKGARCGVIIARLVPIDPGAEADAGAPEAPPALVTAKGTTLDVQVLAVIDSGQQLSEVVVFGDSKRLRMWGLDQRGSFVREFAYTYGRITVFDPKRN